MKQKLRAAIDALHLQTVQRMDDFIRLDRIVPARSSQWPMLRRQFLAVNPACAACGATECVTVHHIASVWEFPGLELDANNCITLCAGGQHCHFLVGHRAGMMLYGDWRFNNPRVAADAALLRNRQRVIFR